MKNTRFFLTVIFFAVLFGVTLQTCDPPCSGDTPICNQQTVCVAEVDCSAGKESNCSGAQNEVTSAMMEFCNGKNKCTTNLCSPDSDSCNGLKNSNGDSLPVCQETSFGSDEYRCVALNSCSSGSSNCTQVDAKGIAWNICHTNTQTCEKSVTCTTGSQCSGLEKSNGTAVDHCNGSECVVNTCSVGGNQCKKMTNVLDESRNVCNQDSVCIASASCQNNPSECSQLSIDRVAYNVCTRSKECTNEVSCNYGTECGGVVRSDEAPLDHCKQGKCSSNVCTSSDECRGMNNVDARETPFCNSDGRCVENDSCIESSSQCQQSDIDENAWNICSSSQKCVHVATCSSNSDCNNIKAADGQALEFCSGNQCINPCRTDTIAETSTDIVCLKHNNVITAVEPETCENSPDQCLQVDMSGDHWNVCTKEKKCTKSVLCTTTRDCQEVISGSLSFNACILGVCSPSISCSETVPCDGTSVDEDGKPQYFCSNSQCVSRSCTPEGNECGSSFTCHYSLNVCFPTPDLAHSSSPCRSDSDCQGVLPYCSSGKVCISCLEAPTDFCSKDDASQPLCDPFGSCIADFSTSKQDSQKTRNSATLVIPEYLNSSVSKFLDKIDDKNTSVTWTSTVIILKFLESIELNAPKIDTDEQSKKVLNSLTRITEQNVNKDDKFISRVLATVDKVLDRFAAAEILGDLNSKFLDILSNLVDMVYDVYPNEDAQKTKFREIDSLSLKAIPLVLEGSSGTVKLFSSRISGLISRGSALTESTCTSLDSIAPLGAIEICGSDIELENPTSLCTYATERVEYHLMIKAYNLKDSPYLMRDQKYEISVDAKVYCINIETSQFRLVQNPELKSSLTFQINRENGTPKYRSCHRWKETTEEWDPSACGGYFGRIGGCRGVGSCQNSRELNCSCGKTGTFTLSADDDKTVDTSTAVAIYISFYFLFYLIFVVFV